jgi:hypothetical protein
MKPLIALVLLLGPLMAGQDATASRALDSLRKQADKGDRQAQFNLGVRYFQAVGVAQDYAEAMRWFRKAADQGLASAQFNVGLMYYKGRGVAEDDAEARRWFRKAADQGHSAAQWEVGKMYQEGDGGPQDDGEAKRWFLMAADQGFAHAQYDLGAIYAKTCKVNPLDLTEAYFWTSLAALRATGEDGRLYANMRDFLATMMTASQIAETQRRIEEWRPRPSGAQRPAMK